MESPFNIVLVRPEIPQNTGNIGRLCVSTDTKLHIVKPTAFSMEDKYIKRAGLDYWFHLDLCIYENWKDFIYRNENAVLYFFSTKGEKIFWDCPYEKNSFLVFGNESSGLPEDFYGIYKDSMYTIPMGGEFHRSFNLANSAAVALFEGLRRFNRNQP